MNSNSPMASPLGGGGGGGGPQQMMHQHMQHAPPQQQIRYIPDSHDEDQDPPPRGSRRPQAQSQANALFSSLLDDTDKRLTLLVFALLVLAQQPQTREAVRSLATSLGVQIVGTPYESLVISTTAAAAFFYYVHNYSSM